MHPKTPAPSSVPTVYLCNKMLKKTVSMSWQATTEGLFSASQLCVRVKALEIILPLPKTNLRLQVACYPPSFTLTPKQSGNVPFLLWLFTLQVSFNLYVKAFW